MEQGEHHQVNSYQKQIMDVVEELATNFPIAETPRVEPRQSVEALSQPNLETDMEEV
jgi:hypothetical protein